VPIQNLIDYLEGGDSIDEFLEDFPSVTRDQVIAHPQIKASGILLESDHPDAGRLRQTRTAARFASPTVVRRGAPRLGQHSEEVLAELGLTQDDVAGLRRQGVVGP
jgi:crotonobetainyl-CoA:carnitine CoA-transferase CaiB-like acyl-CoA transferase